MNRLAKATPSSSAGRKLPRNWQASQNVRHVAQSFLLRNSKDTARKIRANNRMSRGAYSALNITAYAFGKAAKVTPPAVISHTSLPSQ